MPVVDHSELVKKDGAVNSLQNMKGVDKSHLPWIADLWRIKLKKKEDIGGGDPPHWLL